MTVIASAARTPLIAGLLLVAVGRAAPGQQPRPGAAKDSITPALIALGDSVFHGKVGGATCFACHGADAKGTAGLAPALTGPKWLHGDGSYGFIVRVVQQGVPKPKQSPAPMPPMGGANLTPDQVRAVAAYVYALSHPKPMRSP